MAFEITTHPYNYSYSAVYSDLQKLALGEGYCSYSGVGENEWVIIGDSGTMADFLEDDDPMLQHMISIKHFTNKDEWLIAVAAETNSSD